MRVIVFSLVVLILSGCGTGHHKILGTTYGWSKDRVEILLDAQVGDLRIRHVRLKNGSCVSGYSEHLELDGRIGPDSTAIVGKLLPRLAKCITSKGTRIVNTVYLSSGGGHLADGYELGELFKKYRVETEITGGQECASSCAIAFLGGKFRTMERDAKILFHAPYKQGMLAIDCSSRSEMTGLQNYYEKMLGASNGGFLFDRTMSYCSSSSGWTLNADAAKLFGITTD